MARARRATPTSPQRRTSGSHSDKENLVNSAHSKRQNNKMSSSKNSAKRQRLADQGSNSQAGGVSTSRRHSVKDFYDPDQDTAERRRIRKGLRELNQNLNDSRNEFLQAGNNGLYETLIKANEYFQDVKQTSDATIDSRLLVNLADLSYKKTAALVLGDSSAGIDVDEFVSKCISFMRNGPEDQNATITSTQRRRAPRRTQADIEDSDDDDDVDNGDGMNWDWLGRAACFCHSARPAVSGFLLGPLSVAKRNRQIAQRRARERIDPSQAIRPQELREEDLDKQESTNLAAMCTSINKLLGRTRDNAETAVTRVLEEYDEPSDETVQDVMSKHHIADDGGVPLFQFCINPQSFGQSVENLFYLSFLVRDGTVGISTDSRGLPTLHPSQPFAPSEAQRRGVQKHQSVFSLDFDTWTDLIEVYNIEKSIIPARQEEQHNTAQGWYS